MKITKIITIICVFFMTLGMINGCSTAKGFGQDVSAAGRDIQKAAS